MKKLNDANMGIFVLLSVCLCLFSCNNDNDNLPKDYAGFEHSKETVECESDKSECELKIKIVATEKTKEEAQKAAEEAKKGEAEDVLKKLLASGMTAEEILAKLQ